MTKKNQADTLYDQIGQYTTIPFSVIELWSSIGTDAIAIFVYIRYRSGQNPGCWPSYDTIQADTGLTRKRIATAIKALESANLLERRKRYGQSTIYILKMPISSSTGRLLDDAPVVQQVDYSSLTGGLSVVQQVHANKIQLTRFNEQDSRENSKNFETLLSGLTENAMPTENLEIPAGCKADIRRAADAWLQDQGIDDPTAAVEFSAGLFKYLRAISDNPAMARNAGGVLGAIAAGADKDAEIKQQISESFAINPNWDKKGWKAVVQFIKERPESEPLAEFIHWWKTYDWRGKQGQPPTPDQITELWPKAWSIEQQETSAGVVPPNFAVNDDGSIYV